MRKIILINCLWAAIATSAFFLGKKDQDPNSVQNSGAVNVSRNLAGNEATKSGLGQSGTIERIQKNQQFLADPIFINGDASSKLKNALADSDPVRRNATISQMLLELTPANAAEMLAAFENSPGGRESDRHFNDFLYAWARVSGEDAIKYAMDPDSPKRTRGDEMTAISGWAASDPDSAMLFVDQVENSDTRQWMHLGVTKEMIQNDLDGAIAYSEKNLRGRARGEQVDRIADALMDQRGEQGLIDWINGIDHTPKENEMLSYKRGAIRESLSKIARNDPDKAVQFITDNVTEPFIDSDSLERISHYISDTSIADEVQWLAELPEEVEGQRHALGERFEEFIKEDFEGAGEWLSNQPLGPAYDEAIQDYAFSAAKDDPKAALAWVDRISDERMRNDTLGRLQPKPKK
ncbi:MAG TPA: hypothetical protein EYG40_12705 [Verrucomicrobia bacterium]|nr:hypothetical protein [Verrucomicrobiales bacterium]HIL55881.1 hypothetical protein [Verrucomicrobiota bacterium]